MIKTRIQKRVRLSIFLAGAALFCCSFFAPLPAQSAEETIPSPKAAGQEQQQSEKATVLDRLKELPSQASAPIKTAQIEIDKAGERINSTIETVEKGLSPVLGSWVESKLLWGITGFKLGLCLLLLLLVLTVERLLRFFLRRRLRLEEVATGSATWLPVFFHSLSQPLSLFIWVFGTYGAFSPLLPHLQQPGLPQLLHGMITWTADVGGTIVALWFLYRLLHLVDSQIRRWARSRQDRVGATILVFSRNLRNPVKMLIFLLFFRLVVPLFDLPGVLLAFTGQTFGLLLVAAVAWLTVQGVNAFEEIVLGRYKMDVADNLGARKMHTQVRFLKRLAITLVLVLTSASMLMMFDKVRQLGTSILASAGVAGLIFGLAAQRSISNMLVGLQIAITQPIRLDDVVIIEKEWGRIEEITSTYVVVKLWDLRRLIVPTTYFTEKTFQNWTRVSAEVLGTVFLYLDYTVPVDAIRQELQRVLATSKLWDGKVGQVQVTDTTAQAMELRLLLSASDASLAWDLRCEVREKMIAFVQDQFPESLPRIRAEVQERNSPETRSEPHRV